MGADDDTRPAGEGNPLLRLGLELGPLVLFFVVNARVSFQAATAVFMLAITVSLIASRVIEKRLPIMPLVTVVFVLIFGPRGVIFGLCAVLGQLMYLRGPSTEIQLSFGLAARVCVVFSRSSPSPHRTAGGPRKLVLGMASAMGNNRGVFIPPSFPSLGLHRNLY